MRSRPSRARTVIALNRRCQGESQPAAIASRRTRLPSGRRRGEGVGQARTGLSRLSKTREDVVAFVHADAGEPDPPVHIDAVELHLVEPRRALLPTPVCQILLRAVAEVLAAGGEP